MLNRHTGEIEIESAHATPKRVSQSEDHRENRTLKEAMRIAKSTKWLNKEEHEALMEEFKNSPGETQTIRHGDFSNYPNSG